jgi:G:T/U-mismatch repair DNA glycosylase
MKILIKFALFIAVLTVFSCSKNDDPAAPSTANTLILPKKITETSFRGGSASTYTNEFVFENNVLKSSSNGTTNRTEFVYNGDKVVQTNKFINNVASGSNTFNYTGDKLNYVLSNSGDKTEFIYNGNTVSSVLYKTVVGTVETTNDQLDLTFNAANNKIQEIQTNSYSGTINITKETYTFDTKSSPITNFNKYLKLLFSSEGIARLSTNNLISKNRFSPNTSATPTEQFSYQITYNSNNYPTRIIQTNSATSAVVSETTIEYY